MSDPDPFTQNPDDWRIVGDSCSSCGDPFLRRKRSDQEYCRDCIESPGEQSNMGDYEWC